MSQHSPDRRTDPSPAVAAGRRGVGPAGRRLRHAQRTGQLQGVRRAPPSPPRRAGRSPARPRLRRWTRRGAGDSGGCDVLRHRRVTALDRRRPRSQPARRPSRRRHARPSLGRRLLRRRHQLPRDLGDDPRRRRRGAPRPGTRWAVGDHRLGSHQDLPGRVGVGAAGAGERAEGGAPGGDGGTRPARAGRGVARSVRVRRRRAPRDPVRLGVRRSRCLRPRHVVAGPGVRGHSERR